MTKASARGSTAIGERRRRTDGEGQDRSDEEEEEGRADQRPLDRVLASEDAELDEKVDGGGESG